MTVIKKGVGISSVLQEIKSKQKKNANIFILVRRMCQALSPDTPARKRVLYA